MTGKIQAFTMPKWGIEMEEGVIREWHAKEGDIVKEGDLFAVIETDKIANDVELEFTGKLRKRIGKEEDAYKVGALLAVFADDDVNDAQIAAFVKSFKAADAGFGHDDASPTSATGGTQEKVNGASTPNVAVPEGMSISPKALDLAKRAGLNLNIVAGSGRNGRISLQDVEQAAKAQGLGTHSTASTEPVNPHTVIKLSSMRRTIAKRLTEATQTIPHFYLRTEIDVTPLLALRTRLKDQRASAPSVNDYLIKACANALMEVPAVNVHWQGEEIHQFAHADISVAVATDGGLITPIVTAADQKTVDEIAMITKDLAARARAEKLQVNEFKGGTFSISNLGMYGVTSFDAVVNPPMAAILAVGAATDGKMCVTLSCDHRAIDGALGGRFLQALKRIVEDPTKL